MEILYMVAGVFIGYFVRYYRDRKIASEIVKELEALKQQLKMFIKNQ